MHGSSSTNTETTSGRGDTGFTLVEILIAIVLVGILSAVVVVGISNLTNKGSSSACAASQDAAKAGAVVYYTSQSAFPTTLQSMTVATTGVNAAPAALTLPQNGISFNAAAITGPPAVAVGNRATSTSGWVLTMTPGTAGVSPTFACS